MKWAMVPVLLCVATLSAAAQNNELFQLDKPLRVEQALQLLLFEQVLFQIRYEIEHGRDPMQLLVGKTPLQLMALAAERRKEQLTRGDRPAAPVKAAGRATVSADEAFPATNLRLVRGAQPQLAGELTNKSGRGFREANFAVRYFDAAGALLGNGTVSLRDFTPGQTRSWSTPLPNLKPEQVKSYTVEFDEGH